VAVGFLVCAEATAAKSSMAATNVFFMIGVLGRKNKGKRSSGL
jgi:hypothetical protein